ncbi:ASCH domain-containing protein [Haloarcula salina]|uniref:ASCH domain-containing protein n=1 Tax=Haloarcula salina TaxID=1429914 RepID=A0AA41KJB5_9EURY|nr:ASCH domain-containing protein [Haloarcula salina]MBV0902573.1 ASCH domain-containing protein [Haloarcula salina]
MAQIDAGEILPNDRVQQMAVDGRVTQLHRGHQYAEEGDTFEIDGTTFEVTDVTHRTLGDLTDEDAQREGSEDLDAYRERMTRVHGSFEWDDDSEVVRHRFASVEE